MAQSITGRDRPGASHDLQLQAVAYQEWPEGPLLPDYEEDPVDQFHGLSGHAELYDEEDNYDDEYEEESQVFIGDTVAAGGTPVVSHYTH